MNNESSTGIRHAARVILIDDADCVLFLHAQEPKHGHRFWIMPGGGLDKGESHEQAAIREMIEETGYEISLGPCVWLRKHKYVWKGSPAEQHEKYFVARIKETSPPLTGNGIDDYIIGSRWWSLAELKSSTDHFAPKRIAELLPDILKGNHPSKPIDCGV